MPDFSHENTWYASNPGAIVVGLDEAGCGPWAGPVVAGAAIIDRDHFPPSILTLIHDSKTLSSAKRDTIVHQIQDHEGKGCWTAVASASVAEIDALNIRQAGILAMERAYTALCARYQLTVTAALVDGTVRPKLPCFVMPLKKGDSLSYSIALASICAKVARDRIMADLALLYPAYGFDRHAGYGTAHHRQAIEMVGLTPHHRRSFRPIAAYAALEQGGINADFPRPGEGIVVAHHS